MMVWTDNTSHVPTRLRQHVLNRDGHHCAQCGDTNHLEVDHIRNLKAGGSNNPNNLQLLCHTCHNQKTQHEAKQARARHLRRTPPPLGMT